MEPNNVLKTRLVTESKKLLFHSSMVGPSKGNLVDLLFRHGKATWSKKKLLTEEKNNKLYAKYEWIVLLYIKVSINFYAYFLI